MDDSQITDPRARAFVDALERFEQDADTAAFAALFADGATLLRLDGRGERTDVEQFWREYVDQFSEVSTTFTHVVEGSDTVALEWSSAARFHDGSPADYRGVTVLALDDDKITGLRTYYDTAVFTRIPASAAAGDTP